jgi:hypothetical protein
MGLKGLWVLQRMADLLASCSDGAGRHCIHFMTIIGSIFGFVSGGRNGSCQGSKFIFQKWLGRR